MDCIFCKIINKEITARIVYEDDIVLAFLDNFPDSNGHTLIVPKKHYKDVLEIEDNTLNHIMSISKKLYAVLEDKLNFDGLTLIQNNGNVQEIKHFHLHLKPAYLNNQKLSIEEVYDKIKNN